MATEARSTRPQIHLGSSAQASSPNPLGLGSSAGQCARTCNNSTRAQLQLYAPTLLLRSARRESSPARRLSETDAPSSLQLLTAALRGRLLLALAALVRRLLALAALVRRGLLALTALGRLGLLAHVALG
eukprot:12735109-Alexandrium_andersonii.AAC.1